MLEKTIIYILTITLIVSCSDNQVIVDTQTVDTDTVTKKLDTINIKKESKFKIQEFENEYDFYDRLLHSLKPQDYNFSNIIKLYDGYVVDTITKFKNKNTIRVNLLYDYGVDLYVKHLDKLKVINYKDLKFDSASVFKYYHGPDPSEIKDDE